MKKLRLSIFISLLMVIALTACSSKDEISEASKILGIDCGATCSKTSKVSESSE